MKKIFQKKQAPIIIIAMMFLGSANAQWAVNGTHIYNTNAGKVGIGIGANTPAGTLTVKGSGGVPAAAWANSGLPLFTGFGEQTIGNADYILSQASTLANARPVFIGRRSRGTLAAPGAVVNNDYLSSFLVSGYDGTAFQNPAAVDFYVDGVPTTGNVPGRISFVTGSNSTNRLERLKIGSTGNIAFNNTQLALTQATGNVGIGTATPQANLDINGDMALRMGVINLTNAANADVNTTTNRKSVYRITYSQPLGASISGLTGGVDGRTITLINTATSPMGIVSDGASNPSAAANRIVTNDGSNLYIQPNGAVTILYDATASRWRVSSFTKPDVIVPASVWSPNGNDVYNTNNGNVGIGTNTPTSKLDLVTDNTGTYNGLHITTITSNTTSGLKIDNQGSGYSGLFSSAGSANGFRSEITSSVNPYNAINGQTAGTGIGGNFNSQFGTAGYFNSNAGTAIIVGNGNVGIGTGTPTNKLSVDGNVDFTGNVGIGTNTPNAKLDIAGTIKIADGSQGVGKVLTSDANGLSSWVAPAATWSVSGNNVVNSNLGNVGIGTTSAVSKLDVSGDPTSTSPVISATTTYVGSENVTGIQSYSKPGDGFGYGVFATGGFVGGKFISDGGAAGIDTYGVFASASGTAAGGRYGIFGNASGAGGTRYGVYGYASGGTENWGGYFPTKTYTSELRVGGTKGATGFIASINGKLIATEIFVQPTATWPDYVFGKDHNLMPLDELEASINANKHLPGIPAASEVKEKGINLGDMQTRSMEKIEELTLYVIEQQKAINLLKEQNAKLAAAVSSLLEKGGK